MVNLGDEKEVEFVRAVDKLRLGVAQWNEWIDVLTDNVIPDLSGADLSKASGISIIGANLRRAYLRDVNFTKQNLQHCDFSGADLSDATFKSCSLNGAHFNDCTLNGCNFSNAVLSGAQFYDSTLNGCNFSNAVLGNPQLLRSDFYHIQRYPGDDLQGVIWAPLETKESIHSDYKPYDISEEEYNEWKDYIMGGPEEYYKAAMFQGDLTGANLRSAVCDNVDFRRTKMNKVNLEKAGLRNCDFSSTNLSEAVLQYADLTGAELHETNLEKADLRFAKHFVLDGNNVSSARFDPNVKTGWLALRRDYTGIRLAMTSIALLLFLSPYIFRFLYYSVIYKVQQMAINGNPNTIFFESGRHFISWEEHFFLPYILGWYEAPAIVIFNSLLLVYNFARAILTFFVSRLREEESRSGFTPPYKMVYVPNAIYSDVCNKGLLYTFWLLFFKQPYLFISTRGYTYHWLLPLDKLVRIILWIAIVSLLMSVFDIINRTIYIPA